MILTIYPGTEEIIKKIESAKWFKFDKLPVDNVPMNGVVADLGLIPYLQVQTDYQWESTIALWINRIHEYQKNPYELKKGFQLTDIVDMYKPIHEQRIDKSDYDIWLPVYEQVKSKFQL